MMVKKPKRAAKPKKKAAPLFQPLPQAFAIGPDDVVTFQEPDPDCCGNCRFWVDAFCKRYPPDKREGQANAMHRSVMLATEWCGEHQRLSQ